MKTFSHILFLLAVVILGAILLCACGGSGRTGVGPYDFTDYSALEAQQERREAQMEMTMYPIDDYYDYLSEQSATREAADALTEYLSEEYFREMEAGE